MQLIRVSRVRKEEDVSGKEKWIMAAIIAAGALYLFELDALYLFAVAAVIYFVSRSC